MDKYGFRILVGVVKWIVSKRQQAVNRTARRSTTGKTRSQIQHPHLRDVFMLESFG